MIGLLNIAFVRRLSAGTGGGGCAAGSGGSTSGYGLSISPNGGTYSNGLEITVNWSSAPPCATHMRVALTNESATPGSYEVYDTVDLPVGPGTGTVTLYDPSVPPQYQIKPQKISMGFADKSDPDDVVGLNTDTTISAAYT